jgi:hypothetical protein
VGSTGVGELGLAVVVAVVVGSTDVDELGRAVVVAVGSAGVGELEQDALRSITSGRSGLLFVCGAFIGFLEGLSAAERSADLLLRDPRTSTR